MAGRKTLDSVFSRLMPRKKITRQVLANQFQKSKTPKIMTMQEFMDGNRRISRSGGTGGFNVEVIPDHLLLTDDTDLNLTNGTLLLLAG